MRPSEAGICGMNANTISTLIARLSDFIPAGQRAAATAHLTLVTRDEISIGWRVGDAHCAANEAGYILTDEGARNLLEAVEHNHDAAYGINWDTLRDEASSHGRKLTAKEKAEFDELRIPVIAEAA